MTIILLLYYIISAVNTAPLTFILLDVTTNLGMYTPATTCPLPGPLDPSVNAGI